MQRYAIWIAGIVLLMVGLVIIRLSYMEAEPSFSPKWDKAAPNGPTTLTAIPGDKYVNFSWDEANDNVGVKGYRLYVNDIERLTTTNLSASVVGLTNGQSYRFHITAYDEAGNESAGAFASAIPIAPVKSKPTPTPTKKPKKPVTSKITPKPTKKLTPTPTAVISLAPTTSVPTPTPVLQIPPMGLYINPDVIINAKDKLMTFRGTTKPGLTLLLTINSQPVTVNTRADINGSWQASYPYNQDLLEPGPHQAYITKLDNPLEQSNIVTFQIPYMASYAQATDVPNFPPFTWWLMKIAGMVTFLYLLIVLFLGILYRKFLKILPIRPVVIYRYLAIITIGLAIIYSGALWLNWEMLGIGWSVKSLIEVDWRTVINGLGALAAILVMIKLFSKIGLFGRNKIDLMTCILLILLSLIIFIGVNFAAYRLTNMTAIVTSGIILLIWLINLGFEIPVLMLMHAANQPHILDNPPEYNKLLPLEKSVTQTETESTPIILKRESQKPAQTFESKKLRVGYRMMEPSSMKKIQQVLSKSSGQSIPSKVRISRRLSV